ncbi:hypothetical protein PAQU9191_01161 [Photobacterium aquimaris]|uniref:Uncharacterized protein n=2 Tax=Photobacterium aquimaris TaxID=512643 RepID=A0A1Y6KUS0_9GAMM|nr:hypothetical protein PAQU9191_01161 [Photobacterium aquimaris]
MVLADKFFSYWCDVVEERNDDIERAWCDNKAYSHLIIHSQNSIVKGVAEKLGFNCYNGDYYYIDSVFYDNDDYIKDFPEQCFLKRQDSHKSVNGLAIDIFQLGHR